MSVFSSLSAKRVPYWLVMTALGLLLLLAAFIGLFAGSSDIGLEDLASWLAGGDLSPTAQLVFFTLRGPRVILALVVGISLAQGGVVFQSVLRNPLAEPYILGISGGAALGALAATRFASFGPLGLFALAFLGALLASTAVFAIAARLSRNGPLVMLLAGTMLNTLCGALLVLMLALAHEPGSQAVFFWLLGDLGRLSSGLLPWLLALSLPLWLAVGLLSYRLNLHALGEATAGTLGLNVERSRWLLLTLSSLATALVVAAAGLVGFVGLIVPHLARALVGADSRRLLPAAMLLGAALLVIADAAARSLFAPAELPVGVFTALTGVPFFIGWLLRQSHDA